MDGWRDGWMGYGLLQVNYDHISAAVVAAGVSRVTYGQNRICQKDPLS